MYKIQINNIQKYVVRDIINFVFIIELQLEF